MNKIKVMMLAVLFTAFSAQGASYDAASGYVTMSKNSSSTAKALEPEIWSDVKAPHAGTNYYVKAGWQLYFNYAAVTNFMGEKLVVAGDIRQEAGSSSSSVEFPSVILLPGSLVRRSGFGCLKGPFSVCGVAGQPVEVHHAYGNSKTAEILMHEKWDGDADAYMVMRRKRGTDEVTTNGVFRCYNADAWTDYRGTLEITGPLLEYVTGYDFKIPGSVVLTNGASLALNKSQGAAEFGTLEVYGPAVCSFGELASATVGDLVLHDGVTQTLSKKMTSFVVTNSMVLGDGARIRPTANLLGSWKTGDPPAPVKLMTFGPKVTRPTDYSQVFDIQLPSNANGGVPNLVFSEAEQADGSVDVYYTYREVVTFTSNAGYNQSPFNPVSPVYSSLSDPNPISSEKDYFTNGKIVTVHGGDYEFVGHSLTVSGGKLSIYNSLKFTCADLYLTGGWIGPQKVGGAAKFYGKIHAQGGSLAIGGGDKSVNFIYSDIDGADDLAVVRGGVSDDVVGDQLGILELHGDNSGFSGRLAFGNHAGTNGVLKVWNKDNLGGARDDFAADALSIADTCALNLCGTNEVFDVLSRGWMFEGESAVQVGAMEVSATVLCPVTVTGTLTKKGTGRLVVASVAGESSTVLDVAEGELQGCSANAFAGLPSLTFENGTKLVVDAATADVDLKVKGLDLTAVALTVPQGGVPVVFESVSNGVEIAVATLASEADAAKFAFVKPWGLAINRSVVPTDDGKCVLKARFFVPGLAIILR